MSKFKKYKDCLWTAATQDYCIIKTVELGSYGPDRSILKVNKAVGDKLIQVAKHD